jgi:hypothetical protein
MNDGALTSRSRSPVATKSATSRPQKRVPHSRRLEAPMCERTSWRSSTSSGRLYDSAARVETTSKGRHTKSRERSTCLVDAIRASAAVSTSQHREPFATAGCGAKRARPDGVNSARAARQHSRGRPASVERASCPARPQGRWRGCRGCSRPLARRPSHAW